VRLTKQRERNQRGREKGRTKDVADGNLRGGLGSALQTSPDEKKIQEERKKKKSLLNQASLDITIAKKEGTDRTTIRGGGGGKGETAVKGGRLGKKSRLHIFIGEREALKTLASTQPRKENGHK